MRRAMVVLTVLVLSAGMPMLSGHSAEPKDKVADLMERKLKEAQKVLAGVALNDFDMISKHASELITISNQTEWRVIKSPRYELYSEEFRRNADSLVKNAKDKNADGAALAYVEMTLTCVKCHKHVREVRMARRD